MAQVIKCYRCKQQFPVSELEDHLQECSGRSFTNMAETRTAQLEGFINQYYEENGKLPWIVRLGSVFAMDLDNETGLFSAEDAGYMTLEFNGVRIELDFTVLSGHVQMVSREQVLEKMLLGDLVSKIDQYRCIAERKQRSRK